MCKSIVIIVVGYFKRLSAVKDKRSLNGCCLVVITYKLHYFNALFDLRVGHNRNRLQTLNYAQIFTARLHNIIVLRCGRESGLRIQIIFFLFILENIHT